MPVSVFVGTSLDGFIARPDGSFDFLPTDGAPGETGFEEFFAGVDALVMGRGTYETALAFPDWPYGGKPVVVLSHRDLPGPPRPTVERMQGEPGQVVAALAARGLRSLYVDGGLTIQAFLRAGVVDRLVVTRVPVLIGVGRPLFGPLPRDVPLRHVATRTLSGGMVQSTYDVVR